MFSHTPNWFPNLLPLQFMRTMHTKWLYSNGIVEEYIILFHRSFGGEVSWHESVAVGATYPESDEKITHQIVDRPSMDKQYLSRYLSILRCRQVERGCGLGHLAVKSHGRHWGQHTQSTMKNNTSFFSMTIFFTFVTDLA